MGIEGEPAPSPRPSAVYLGALGMQLQAMSSPTYLLCFPVQHITMQIFQRLLCRLNVITFLVDLAKMHKLDM